MSTLAWILLIGSKYGGVQQIGPFADLESCQRAMRSPAVTIVIRHHDSSAQCVQVSMAFTQGQSR
jgi:hypothetical protein